MTAHGALGAGPAFITSQGVFWGSHWSCCCSHCRGWEVSAECTAHSFLGFGIQLWFPVIKERELSVFCSGTGLRPECESFINTSFPKIVLCCKYCFIFILWDDGWSEASISQTNEQVKGDLLEKAGSLAGSLSERLWWGRFHTSPWWARTDLMHHAMIQKATFHFLRPTSLHTAGQMLPSSCSSPDGEEMTSCCLSPRSQSAVVCFLKV